MITKGIFSFKRRQRGQSVVEHLLMGLGLVILTLGTIQLALIYRAKATLNNATFKAAREGSLNYANSALMRTALVDGMAPLGLVSKENALTADSIKNHYDDPNIIGYTALKLSNRAEYGRIPVNGGGAKLNIISPTKEVFDLFAVEQRTLEPCARNCPYGGKMQESNTVFLQIPNDNLAYRSSATRPYSGGRINLQDANLLKIESHWCYGMEVPLVNRLIRELMGVSGGIAHEHWAPCNAKTELNEASGEWRKFYIPLSAQSLVRMQTPVRCEGDPQLGRNCRNLN